MISFWIFNLGCWMAEAAPAAGISAETAGAIIGSMLIALIGGGYVGTRVASIQRVRFTEPLQEIPVKRVSSPPSWDQHSGLERRVTCLEAANHEMRREMAQQYREILESGGMREIRLTEKLDGIARGIHSRIDSLFPSHPPSRSKP